MSDAWEIDTLRRGFDHLIDTISVDSVLPKARTTGLIAVRDYETCKAEPTEYKQAEKFLLFLEKAVLADPGNFYSFLSILGQVKQESIAEYLRKLIPRKKSQENSPKQSQGAAAMSSSQPIGRLGDTPTILGLNTMVGADGKPLKIIQVISGKDYVFFGTCLLNDEDETTVDLIKKDHLQYGASRSEITRAILKHWLASTATPRTYQHLVDCLKKTDGLDVLAELIEKALTS